MYVYSVAVYNISRKLSILPTSLDIFDIWQHYIRILYFQQNLLRLKRSRSIIVLISPSHFFHFYLVWTIIYKSKTIILSIKREIIITSLLKKVTSRSISTNNFKIDIKLISGRLKMRKNISTV